jgi:hypothetical protein
MLGRVNADLANYPGGHTYTNEDYNFAPPLGAFPEDNTLPEESTPSPSTQSTLSTESTLSTLSTPTFDVGHLTLDIPHSPNPKSAIRNPHSFPRPPD